MKEPLTILHFNDVYNVEPQKHEPAGGAARMAHYVKAHAHLNPLVVFSGDAVNPSLMSIYVKGDQMIPALNGIGVHCAVYGNHDFDFGVDHLEDFAEATNFPWLLSNIVDNINKKPLGNGKIKQMLDWHGTKVGIMGLVEEEWIDTLSTVDPDDITFQDFVEVGNRLAAELREEGADIVIALTHMRWPNDRKVAEMVPGVDIVLGGHDHDYGVEKVNGKYVIKSGTDFREISKITMTRGENGLDIEIERIAMDSSMPEDEGVKAEIDKFSDQVSKNLEEVLGVMGVELDGRFAKVRTQETNLGNFIADIVLEAVPADICLLGSGTLRSDRIHPKGEFKLRDLLTILPFSDPLTVKEVSGKTMIKALENGVSEVPKMEGRFPQVAGLRFTFDPNKPAGQRVEPNLVTVQDERIEMEKMYKLCSTEFIASGKDGYDVLADCKVIMDSEGCPNLITAVRNHFESVQILNHEKTCRSGHRQNLCSIVRRNLLIRQTLRMFAKSSTSKLLKDGGSEGTSAADDTSETTDTSQKQDMQAILNAMKESASEKQTAEVAQTTDGSTEPEPESVQGVSEEPGSTENGSTGGKLPNFAILAKATHAFLRNRSIQQIEKENQSLCPKVDGRIQKIDDKIRERMLAPDSTRGVKRDHTGEVHVYH